VVDVSWVGEFDQNYQPPGCMCLSLWCIARKMVYVGQGSRRARRGEVDDKSVLRYVPDLFESGHPLSNFDVSSIRLNCAIISLEISLSGTFMCSKS